MDEDGRQCPYVEHGLETETEHQAWHVLMTTLSQMRVRQGGGVYGLDLGTVISVSGLYGYDQKAVLDILADAESVIVEQINEQVSASSDSFGGQREGGNINFEVESS